jgi:2-C-methyl-D-erythritol 2,4-cyclodiphosphate synthase
VHAVCDALLGAAALGDIGGHFPNHDPAFKDADSRSLLKQCAAKIQLHGWAVGNVDLTVVADAPKIAPFVETMRLNLAQDLDIAVDAISVKATTKEGLQVDGVECHAVVLLIRRGM